MSWGPPCGSCDTVSRCRRQCQPRDRDRFDMPQRPRVRQGRHLPRLRILSGRLRRALRRPALHRRAVTLPRAGCISRGPPMVSRYLEPEIERRSRVAMTRWQSLRVRDQVRHAGAHSPFYRRKWKAAGVKLALIRGLDDLTRLPFTTKDELKENQASRPPWGDVLAVPLAEVMRVHLTSATTGRPLAFLDTREDWQGFYHSYARSLHAFGVRKTDMVMAAFSYGPWIGYWSGFYAAQDLGCLVFPAGGLSTEQRIDALLTYPITVLGCTPSYALFLAEQAAKKGIDLAKKG